MNTLLLSKFACATMVATFISTTLFAQSNNTNAQPRDVLSLSATVFAEVIPDLAFVTLTAEAQGVDSAPITREVQAAINTALTQAKEIKGIEARTGAFSTQQKWNGKGVRDGWTVRAELIIKSKDFATLGTLASKLSQQKLMITNTGFEMSRELREREEAALIEHGIDAFCGKATTAIKSFGFANYTLREVNLGSITGDTPNMQPKMMMRSAVSSVAAQTESMAIEGGKTVLTLSLNGSINMTK
jgi:predicted secreted protein